MPASEAMHCLGCDYDLRGVAAGPCPECGRAFDPASSETWSASPAFKRRRLERFAIVLGCLMAPGPLWTAGLIGLEYLAACAWLGRAPQMYADSVERMGTLVPLIHGLFVFSCASMPAMTAGGVLAGVLLARRERVWAASGVLALAGLAYPVSMLVMALYPPGAAWWFD